MWLSVTDVYWSVVKCGGCVLKCSGEVWRSVVDNGRL